MPASGHFSDDLTTHQLYYQLLFPLVTEKCLKNFFILHIYISSSWKRLFNMSHAPLVAESFFVTCDHSVLLWQCVTLNSIWFWNVLNIVLFYCVFWQPMHACCLLVTVSYICFRWRNSGWIFWSYRVRHSQNVARLTETDVSIPSQFTTQQQRLCSGSLSRTTRLSRHQNSQKH